VKIKGVKVKKITLIAMFIFATTFMTGCNKEVKSISYYDTHIEERGKNQGVFE
jgi:hypothetical protein